MDHFTALAERESADLSPDERDALEYYYAALNVAEGLEADTQPRRWCVMAQNVGTISHMLGRIPAAGDPGAIPEILSWIREQGTSSLNAFQRASLRSVPGGEALIR